MKSEYQQAFAEVDEIFKIMPVDLLSKIPIQFRQVISDNKAKDYYVKIEEPLEEQHLKEKTIVILGLIYRDFLCSPEEREKLQLKDAEEIRKIEEEMRQQYDVNNVFEQRKQKSKEKCSTDLTLYKEPNFLQKFFNLIKGIFKKNKF